MADSKYQYTELDLETVHELLPWETNQSIHNMSLEERTHNRHDVDDEEYGNEEW